MRTSCCGSAPTTSASPPVLAKGTHSEAAKTICIGSAISGSNEASPFKMLEEPKRLRSLEYRCCHEQKRALRSVGRKGLHYSGKTETQAGPKFSGERAGLPQHRRRIGRSEHANCGGDWSRQGSNHPPAGAARAPAHRN